jgi:acetolactate decarboxylase
VTLKRWLWILIGLMALTIIVFPVYAQPHLRSDSGFQVSTLGALNIGIYEGAATLAEVKKEGDFGLGTFDKLDGEMILLKGKFYQIKADGVAYSVADQVKTPFTAVTFFQKERSLRLNGKINYPELQQQINAQLPTQNLPYAIRLEGIFPYLKVRSVPPQTTPYPPLAEVVSQQQIVFELRNVRGTLVGFRMPQYLKNVNVPGYHFHFITSDRKAGGHLLEGEFLNPVADVQTLHHWQIKLPQNAAFAQASLP